MPLLSRRDLLCGAAFSAGSCCFFIPEAAARRKLAFPGVSWTEQSPQELGLDPAPLAALGSLVGGSGCLVRKGYLVYEWGDTYAHGDIFSAAKPVISSLLLLAVQERKLPSVDSRVADVVPALSTLNGGKDRAMTWRHLASMTSGYGLSEPPGAAFAYNDYAIALFYEALISGVFGEDGNSVLHTRLTGPLQFERPCHFGVAGAGRPGRLAVCVRDFARFGLLFLNRGNWNGRRILGAQPSRTAFPRPVPARLRMTAGQPADMLPDQRSFGGEKDQTEVGPGWYAFNWWVNGRDRHGRRPMPTLPSSCYAASGLWGRDILLILPPYRMVVCWSGSGIRDQLDAAANPQADFARALTLIRQSIR